MKFCPECASPLTETEREGQIRLACPAEDCRYVVWNNPIPVVAAIVEYRGEVLLVNNEDWPENLLGLVSGFLEAGETPAEGIRREIAEELGLDSEPPQLIGVYSFVQSNQLIIAYHVRCSGEIRTSDEIRRWKLIPADRLKPWDFGTGPAVRDWLNSRSH